MKEYYYISQISKLYGIGPDSLRYYERLGIIKPRRDENGYRIYGLHSLYKLSIIRDLRRLRFSMEQIGEYLGDLSLDNTIGLFESEQQIIQQEISELERIDRSLQARLDHFRSLADQPFEIIRRQVLPIRYCLRLQAKLQRDEEIDLAIKKLHRRHESRIHELGNLATGSIWSMKDFEPAQPPKYHSVFILLDSSEEDEADFSLAAGDYLSLFYRGDYTQAAAFVQALYRYAKEHRFHPVAEPLEIYHIDNRFTTKSDEYVTELQLLVTSEIGDDV